MTPLWKHYICVGTATWRAGHHQNKTTNAQHALHNTNECYAAEALLSQMSTTGKLTRVGTMVGRSGENICCIYALSQPPC